MIRCIHTADIHFGMENYGRIDPATGIHSRLLDFERALNAVIDYAIEHSIDAFLFAGDAYKTAYPSPTQQRLLLNCFLRLYKAGIPIVMVIGNHDHPLTFGKTNALEIFGQIPLDGFHVISKPGIVRLQTKSGLLQIVGIPWPTRNTISLTNDNISVSASAITQYISSAVAKIISTLAEQLEPEVPAVLMGHLTVSSGIFSGSEKRAIYGTDPILLPSQLALPAFDYVALGHLHRYQDLNPNGYPALVYSGSVERIDFGERKEDKGFCVVTIHQKGHTTHEFVKTPTRPFLQIEMHLTDLEDQTEQIIRELKKYQLADAVIKIVYHLPAGQKEKVDAQKIQQACAAAWYVVGIFPVRTTEHKERRASLKVEMDLAHLLSAYCDTKPELKKQKASLIEKALELQSEHQQKEML